MKKGSLFVLSILTVVALALAACGPTGTEVPGALETTMPGLETEAPEVGTEGVGIATDVSGTSVGGVQQTPVDGTEIAGTQGVENANGNGNANGNANVSGTADANANGNSNGNANVSGTAVGTPMPEATGAVTAEATQVVEATGETGAEGTQVVGEVQVVMAPNLLNLPVMDASGTEVGVIQNVIVNVMEGRVDYILISPNGLGDIGTGNANGNANVSGTADANANGNANVSGELIEGGVIPVPFEFFNFTTLTTSAAGQSTGSVMLTVDGATLMSAPMVDPTTWPGMGDAGFDAEIQTYWEGVPTASQ